MIRLLKTSRLSGRSELIKICRGIYESQLISIASCDMSLYFNLSTLAKSKVDHNSLTIFIPEHLYEMWNSNSSGSPTNLAIEDFGISVDLHYVKDGEIFVHLGILKSVCAFFSIPYPERQVKSRLREAINAVRGQEFGDKELMRKQDECNRILACLKNVDAMIRMQTRIVSESERRYIDSLPDGYGLSTLLDQTEELKDLNLVRSIIDIEADIVCAEAFGTSR